MSMPNPFDPSSVGTKPGISQPALDLGMGAELQQQVMAQVLERRKRSMLAANQGAPAFGALAMGPGETGAGNTGGMALQALMGTGIMGG